MSPQGMSPYCSKFYCVCVGGGGRGACTVVVSWMYAWVMCEGINAH